MRCRKLVGTSIPQLGFASAHASAVGTLATARGSSDHLGQRHSIVPTSSTLCSLPARPNTTCRQHLHAAGLCVYQPIDQLGRVAEQLKRHSAWVGLVGPIRASSLLHVPTRLHSLFRRPDLARPAAPCCAILSCSVSSATESSEHDCDTMILSFITLAGCAYIFVVRYPQASSLLGSDREGYLRRYRDVI